MTPPIGNEPAQPVTDPPARPLTNQPERPARLSDIRSPFDEPPLPAPACVRTSMWLWLASGVVPIIGLVYALTRFPDISEHLKQAARTADPAASTETINRISSVTALTALLALAVPVIGQIVLALLMINRRGWARYFLIVVGLVGVPAAAVAFAALSDDGAATRNNLEIGVGIQAVIILLAIVLMFLPAANQWFRTNRR